MRYFVEVAAIVQRFHAQDTPVGTLSPKYIAVDEELTPFLLGPRLAPRSGPYVAPETASERRLDLRSDIYSLGRLLYFVLSGGDPPREAAAVAKLEELSKYPAGLVRIIRKATCQDPEQRYRMVDEMLSDLANFRQHLNVGMTHPEVEDRNTGLLSVVPDPIEEPSIAAAPPTEIPSEPTKKPTPMSNPLDPKRVFRGLGLAIAFAGIAFLVSEHLENSGGLTPLAVEDADRLSSFVSAASMSRRQTANALRSGRRVLGAPFRGAPPRRSRSIVRDGEEEVGHARRLPASGRRHRGAVLGLRSDDFWQLARRRVMKNRKLRTGARTGLSGYTLIDVMIVVLIISVLATVAVNRYQVFVARSKRPESVMTFRALAAQQREYMLTHGKYAGTFDALGFRVEGGERISSTEVQGRRYNYRLVQDEGPRSWYCIASGNLDGDAFLDILGASNPR